MTKLQLSLLVSIGISITACGSEGNSLEDIKQQDAATQVQGPLINDGKAPSVSLPPPKHRETTFLDTPVVTSSEPYGDNQTPAYPWQTKANEMVNGYQQLKAEDLITDLDNPWSIATLPDGRVLVAERSGKIHLISTSFQVESTIETGPSITDLAYVPLSRIGLKDIVASPNFASDKTLYFTYTAKEDINQSRYDKSARLAIGKLTLNLSSGSATDFSLIFETAAEISSVVHFGSRVVFHDGNLFAAIGEHSSTANAQNTMNYAGSIIRIRPNGEIPHDNPFIGMDDYFPAIWSYGHRNPQGLAVRPNTEELWSSEHGPQGGDELNKIEPGSNYGWPTITYGIGGSQPALTQLSGLEQPNYYWDPSIAPSDLIFYSGKMFKDWKHDILLGSMRASSIIRLRLEDDRVIGEERLIAGEGRVRDIAEAHDGSIIWITDDGRLRRLSR
ncbi:PQQ-dependent sugar dehydrogenase [Marinagarivorans cellulosilyticus]|uniref:Aldose sugar dehydrogenase n=1 Tax=Marinagarivorans cellulosilyticus TaxID=2721545 RepID=A0AAN1WFB4_9GAMM|nr:PQQ-dependent sugar dehydrogenase [Marinagarivorans cellulosilyticus]BCD96563.1 aldose sugar dehydrogenase [Marinagarivorans cellulosilyticus]